MAITESSSQQQQSDGKNQLVQQNNHNCNNNHSHQVNMSPEQLDFDECLKDSPKFRQNLKDNLAFVEQLENCMSRTIKQINNFIETGRDHIKSQKDFIASMKALNLSLGSNNNEVSRRVETLLGALEEIMRLHDIVIDQSARTVGNSLTKFINDDLLKIREARKSFDKISHEYDQALIKHSQPLRKQQDDSENLLIATSTAFTHTSLDLSIQLTALQSKKGYDILDSLLSFTKAHNTFFHQGSDLFEDLKPHISDMDEFLNNKQDEFETLVRNLPSKHLMVSNNELRPLSFDSKAQEVHLEGYLFKRASNGFKVWNRRWFILKDHQLLYQKRGDVQPTIMEEDLRLLTVRPVDKADNDSRRFCFELLSPHKSHILQADSESACKTWISAIQAGINAAFHDTEHKAIPKSVSTNEQTNSGATGTSSWGSGFSFRALHQQASSRLNSITTSSDSKDISRNHSKDRTSHSHSTPGDDNDYDDDQSCKVDEQGRSYVPLRDDDDDDRDATTNNAGVKMDSSGARYPAPVSENSALSSADQPEAPVKPQRAYMIILAMPGNDQCADCGAAQPKWASINLGITLCIECAGIHRSLGVHLSKVRSLTLDTEVWSPEIVQLMLNLGNTSVNSAYLACYRGQLRPIDGDSSREERENWIKAKYLSKQFMRPPDAKPGDHSFMSDAGEGSTDGAGGEPKSKVAAGPNAKDHSDLSQEEAGAPSKNESKEEHVGDLSDGVKSGPHSAGKEKGETSGD